MLLQALQLSQETISSLENLQCGGHNHRREAENFEWQASSRKELIVAYKLHGSTNYASCRKFEKTVVGLE